MSSRSWLKVGLVGTFITGVCCFTPLLVLFLSAVGLSALTGWLDIVLLPVLALFIAMTGYALWKRQASKSN